jgi:hypothetical protein
VPGGPTTVKNCHAAVPELTKSKYYVVPVATYVPDPPSAASAGPAQAAAQVTQTTAAAALRFIRREKPRGPATLHNAPGR